MAFGVCTVQRSLFLKPLLEGKVKEEREAFGLLKERGDRHPFPFSRTELPQEIELYEQKQLEILL